MNHPEPHPVSDEADKRRFLMVCSTGIFAITSALFGVLVDAGPGASRQELILRLARGLVVGGVTGYVFGRLFWRFYYRD